MPSLHAKFLKQSVDVARVLVAIAIRSEAADSLILTAPTELARANGDEEGFHEKVKGRGER